MPSLTGLKHPQCQTLTGRTDCHINTACERQIVILILPVKAEIVKRSFIVRLHRGLSNSKEIVLAYTECRVVEKVKVQPQEQAKSQDQ